VSIEIINEIRFANENLFASESEGSDGRRCRGGKAGGESPTLEEEEDKDTCESSDLLLLLH